MIDSKEYFANKLTDQLNRQDEIIIHKMIREGPIIGSNARSKMDIDLVNRIGIHNLINTLIGLLGFDNILDVRSITNEVVDHYLSVSR
jgi:hypothetical protein